MRICQYYFCSARCGDIAIPAHSKRAFGGRSGEPWPAETICPRCGAKALDVGPQGSGSELYWEWQSILHGYHDRYLWEHGRQPSESHAARDRLYAHVQHADAILAQQFDPSRFYLLARGQTRDITDRFHPDPSSLEISPTRSPG